MFDRILVPVDGSEYADRALAMAIDVAVHYGSQLHILHVVGVGPVPPELRHLSDRPSLPGSASPNAAPVYEQEVAKDVAEALVEKARLRALEAGVENVETSWEAGPSAQHIIEYARRNAIDVVLMGARGMGALAGLLVGSVSHKVQNLAPCSVITVR